MAGRDYSVVIFRSNGDKTDEVLCKDYVKERTGLSFEKRCVYQNGHKLLTNRDLNLELHTFKQYDKISNVIEKQEKYIPDFNFQYIIEPDFLNKPRGFYFGTVTTHQLGTLLFVGGYDVGIWPFYESTRKALRYLSLYTETPLKNFLKAINEFKEREKTNDK